MLPALASLLTAKRLRAHGLILALGLWSVYAWNISAPGLLDRNHNLKGTDFLHFYTLGSLALAHRGADLYSMQAQSALVAQRVPAAAGIRYLPLYPPQVSIFFAPFAQLSYGWALTLWLTVSAAIYGLCCCAVWSACPNLGEHRGTIFILAIAYPAFWHLIAWGQTSALALACFTLAFFALRRGKDFLGGVALGCLIFKPQLGLAAAVIFLFTLNWKLIAGAVLSAAAQLSAAWVYYGLDSIRAWLRTMWNVPAMLALLEPRIYQTHSLRTFWSMLVPWPSVALALYVATALAVFVMTLSCWRRSLPLSLRYSALLFASVLVAPHLTVYDLVVLAPAFLLMSDWLIAQPGDRFAYQLKVLVYLSFLLPLLGPVARWTHLQLSVVVMTALLYVIWKIGKNPAAISV